MALTAKRLAHLGIFWVILLLIVLTDAISAPWALLTGIILGLTFGNPYPGKLSKMTKYALQISVVGLGFGINMYQVMATGLNGIFYTAASLLFTMLAGLLLAKLLGVEKKLNHLISAGTAICGGSAIAAVAPAVHASEKEISVSLGIVFILNAIALFIFPVIGEYLQLSQEQFGIWAAIAIHDTSSVVGAAAVYGEEALEIATTLKLTRVLWMVPMLFITAYFFKSKSKGATLPLFILFFLAASVLSTFVGQFSDIYSFLNFVGRKGLIISLFMTGAGISLALIKTINLRPLLLGAILWFFVLTVSLLAVYHFI